MSTITKQWLQQKIADMEATRDEIPFGLDEDDSNTLAAMKLALASLEAEAVAFRSKLKPPYAGSERWDYTDHRQPDAFELENCVIERLFTAQPAPVSVKIPPEKPHTDGPLADGWNACRTAMLQGAEPVKNHDELREKVRREHAEWSQATFGDVGPVGPLKHLSKEALEAAAEPGDLSEWADMQFLLWDAQRRAGISDGEITAAMEEKLKVNIARQWPEPKDGEPRLHIKPAPRQEVKP